MILTKEQIEKQFLDTATDSHEKKYNEGFIDGFLLAQDINKFDTNDVIEFIYKLFKHTPVGSLQKLELRHYEAFIEKTMKNRIGLMDNWTVWVGGIEVNDYFLSKEDAERLAEIYKNNGYTDVVIEEIKDES